MNNYQPSLDEWPDYARVSKIPLSVCQWPRVIAPRLGRDLCTTLQQRWEACRHVDARDVRHPRADEAAWQWQLAWRPLELHGLLHAKSRAAGCTEACS